MTLIAGAAEVIITPPVGTPLDGYSAREGGSTGVHDDLCARALVVDDGATQAAIVGCDLIGVDRRLVAAVRQRAEQATGIPRAHIMVAATHTHAGPAGLRRDLDEPLTDVMSRTIVGAIVAARGTMRPAALKAGRGSVDSVSQSRRDPDGPLDDALRVLLFDSPDPRHGPIASVINFACHATVLYHTNMQVSADYPGYAVRTVQQVLGDAPVVFLNGACGDVNPAWIEQRYDEAARVGSIVGAEAARRLQELRPLGGRQNVWNIRWEELTEKHVPSGELIAAPSLRVLSGNVALRLRTLDPPAAYDERLAALEQERSAMAEDDVEGRRRVMASVTRLRTERGVAARLRGDGPHEIHPELQVIALSPDCAILGLPGEFFVETARQIQAAVGIRHLLVACYANHYIGYVVPRDDFARGGYEAGVTLLDESAEETIRNAAIDLLRELTS